MPHFAFLIEYDGAPFSGWQRQTNQPSVQGTFEAALRILDPALDTIAAAGRTDSGVHAWGQVAQADLVRDWDRFELEQALNQHLKPAPVAVLAVAKVAPDWHARFSAVGRRYTYRVIARRAPLGVEAGRAWLVRCTIDATAMRDAARHLVGRHDFTTFRSSTCQAKSPVKTLDHLSIEERAYPGGIEYRLHFAARSFLHNQVRSFVGTLLQVGRGAWEPGRVADALNARDRAACGPVAPPQGLYLTGVDYLDDPFG